MQLPVDIPEVFKIVTDFKEVAATPIALSLHIDDTADGALIGHVRAAFASAGAHTKVTIDYLSDAPIAVNSTDDMGVIIAGSSPVVAQQASAIRAAGVPAMVIALDAAAVCASSEEAGAPIPPADIITPVKLKTKNPFKRTLASTCESNESAPIDSADSSSEELLTDEAFTQLDTRMGEWIIAACPDKKLAFALAFPFVRRPLALDAITSTSLQNGAVGLVPILPGADMPIMTLNQIKMILQIATAYGQPLDAARAKEIALVVAGAFVSRNIARSLAKLVPVAGWLVSGVVGFAATEAMGRAAIEYFEAGGDMVGLAKVVQTARDDAVKVVTKASDTPAGKQAIGAVKNAAAAKLPFVSKKG